MHGTGPGEIAADGSAVEYYAAVPPDEESAALVHGAVGPGGTILELGAGAGRVTHPLLALGHPVVAVDASAGMLARISGAETVCSTIQDLDLGRAFDGVLLMSYIIDYGGERRPLLDACRRHVAPDGVVIVQRQPPAFYRDAGPREWSSGRGRFRMYDVVRHSEDVVSATIEYRLGGRRWTHSFTSRRFGDEELPEVLGESGLSLDRFLDEEGGWILARPV
ncbi:class I SAM-dependent methyltransferase [Actinomadura kijaniata]|uniref:class I SAM-dependent methyltransferase n=1 Tax=Actinomadura kijaniata TaxID=46161 RepID=UPI003F1CBE60